MATAPNSTPFVPGAYRSINAIFATANTDQSGATGTKATVYAPLSTSNGCYVRDVDVSVPGTSAAAVVVILVSDGTNLVTVARVTVTAVTPSATLACYASGRVPLDFHVPAGGTLYILTTIAQTTHARFTVADY